MTDLTQLNAAELEARASIFLISTELAEVSVQPEDQCEVIALFERIKSHLENWEIPSANIDDIIARKRGQSKFHISNANTKN